MAQNGAGDTATASKKAKLDDSVEEKEFDEETQAALEEIDGCQNDIDAMNEKASEEILKVEQKYNQLRKPHFEKRSGIIGRIPKFWLTAFINHPQLSSIIEEEEEDCLQYLDKLDVEEFEDIKSDSRFSSASQRILTSPPKFCVKSSISGAAGTRSPKAQRSSGKMDTTWSRRQSKGRRWPTPSPGRDSLRAGHSSPGSGITRTPNKMMWRRSSKMIFGPTHCSIS